MLRIFRKDGTIVEIDPHAQTQRLERIHPTRRAEIYECVKRRVHEVTEHVKEAELSEQKPNR